MSEAAPAKGPEAVELPPAVIESFLATTALFHKCDRVILNRVAPDLHAFVYPSATTVMMEGAPADAIGIVFEGRASVLMTGPAGASATLEALMPGEHFGEVPTLRGIASPYSVVVDDGAKILWLRGEVAQILLGKFGAFGTAISQKMAAQIAQLAALVREAPAPAPHAPEPAAAPAPQQPMESAAITPFVELRDYDIQPSVLAMVPAKLIRLHRLLPVKLADQALTVAMVSPRNQAALAELRRTLTGVEIDVVAISQDDFNNALGRFKLDDARAAAKGTKASSINPDSLTFETVTDSAERDAPAAGARSAPGDDVIRWVNKMIVAALDREASDIHIEPTATGPRVRFRAQGVLAEWAEPVPASASMKAVSARIKVLAGLDITEKRLPQDGRIGVTAGKREVDLRVSTLPANRGEKIALRVLEGSGSTRSLDQIFLDPGLLGTVRRALNRPYGGILIAGPTGSGKTSTLYSCLHERRQTRPDTNIIMVEDPIEYRMNGVVQVQVNPTAGLSFAAVLRSMMRQDPDVIVVGEMRDPETATLALEASMTGHLLLSSMHANNTLSTVQRLEELGASRALIAQAVQLALTQRLVRKLCNACKVVEAPPPALLESLIARGIVDRAASSLLPRAVGCDACGGTGYVGRAIVIECLQMTDAVRNAVASGRPLEEIERLAFNEHALMPFSAYSAYLLQRQLISPAEVLLTLAD